jgi:Zn finger protein HypA/HybF involved in hydrogenase expression
MQQQKVSTGNCSIRIVGSGGLSEDIL